MVQFVPMQLAQKFDLIPQDLAVNAVRRTLHAFPETVPQAWAEYLSRDLRTFKLANLNARQIETDTIRAAANPMAIVLANFLDFELAVGLAGMAFQLDPECPAGLERLYRWGAQQLHAYGAAQAASLAGVANQIFRWCRAESHNRVIVVDSPLGGTLPAQVIGRVLQTKGLHAETREFLAPRLDRHAKKFSIKKAAAEFCRSLPSGNFPVIFPDEVLTGTRFRKLYRELRKGLGDRVVPVALSAHSVTGSPNDTNKVTKLQAELSELKCAKQGAPVFTRLPTATLVKIDEGAPLTLSSPFFWAEMDLAAGKRKVNLVFSLMDQMKGLARGLVDQNGELMFALEHMWRQSSDGMLISCAEPYLRQMVPKLVAEIDWETIEDEARDVFKTEYMGAVPPTDLQSVRVRFDWVLKAVYDQLIPTCPELPGGGSPAGLVVNALRDLYALMHGVERKGSPRDRDFCECTIPVVHPDLAFHEELVRLIVAQALEL